jgi:DNA-directed RNA polymerase specialized sigma24 family protein
MLNETFTDKILLVLTKREVFRLYLSGYEPKEIAEKINCSLTWVKEVIKEIEEEYKNK